MTRLITIQIQHPDKDKVDRLANLITDDLGLTLTFLQGTNDYFAEEKGVRDRLPTMTVTNHACQ